MRKAMIEPVDEGRPQEWGDTLAALDRCYRQPLIRYFNRRISERDDVPDLVQDVFLRLVRIEYLRDVPNAEGYVFATANSVLRDRARRLQSRRAISLLPLTENDGREILPSPDREFSDREAMNRFRWAMRQLPDRTLHVFIMRAFEGYKISEIANRIGISTRAVEKHLVKARLFLLGATNGTLDEALSAPEVKEEYGAIWPRLLRSMAELYGPGCVAVTGSARETPGAMQRQRCK